METDDAKAKRLLNEQLKELESVRGLTYKDPHFKTWRDTTRGYLERFLPPNSPHLSSFRNLSFIDMRIVPYGAPSGYISPEDRQQFIQGCHSAEATIKAVLKYIEEFGVHVEQASTKQTTRRGGVSQTFHAPVTIHSQAIATDNAIQRIGQMGEMGASLKEIADLFQQSMDLTRRQVQEGLAGIERLASEVEKAPDRRNWKSMIEGGEKVLAVADKATDLAHRLAPYTPTIVALVEKAKHILGC